MKKFDNYRKNLDVLRLSDQQDLNNEFIISGIIDKFSIQFELGWKVLKELLTYEGINAAKTGSPREIIKQAYQYYPCIEEDVWLDMLSQRNNMAHIYDGNAAKALAQEIISRFIPAFEKLEKSICERYADLLDTLLETILQTHGGPRWHLKINLASPTPPSSPARRSASAKRRL